MRLPKTSISGRCRSGLLEVRNESGVEKVKRNVVVLLVFAIAGVAFGDTEIVNGVEYSYTKRNGEATIRARELFSPAIPNFASGPLVIPSQLSGCPVTTSEDYAFSGCSSLTSVMISGTFPLYTVFGDNCERITEVNILEGFVEIVADPTRQIRRSPQHRPGRD